MGGLPGSTKPRQPTGVGDGVEPALSARESDRSGSLTSVTSAQGIPQVTVMPPSTPRLMAHQWPETRPLHYGASPGKHRAAPELLNSGDDAKRVPRGIGVDPQWLLRVIQVQLLRDRAVRLDRLANAHRYTDRTPSAHQQG